MTKQEALEILDWIPTKGDEVDAIEMAIEALSAQPDLLDDGTLMITVPQGMLEKVKRVLVDEVGTKNCKLMYQDAKGEE